MDDALKELGEYIVTALADQVTGVNVSHHELMVYSTPSGIHKVATFLKEDSACQFKVLIDICGVDHPERNRRFDVVYNLLSLTHNQRVRVKVQTDDSTPVPSINEVFSAAGWFEREVWDMYGVMFSDHPDLRRLLTDYGFEGHPLRKEFPLTGYVEVRYDDEQKRVVYEPVKLAQEFRTFDFLSPWEGVQALLPGDEKATKEDG